MKDGAIIANSGHFNVEIDINALEDMKTQKRRLRPFLDEYTVCGRQEDLPPWRGEARQPGSSGRPSVGGHGHEFRKPGPLCRIRVEHGKEIGEEGVRRAHRE